MIGWLAQTTGGPPIEGYAQYGVLGLTVLALAWLLWQFLKQQREDLITARQELKDERAAHAATREQTAAMLGAATTAMERMARRRDR